MSKEQSLPSSLALAWPLPGPHFTGSASTNASIRVEGRLRPCSHQFPRAQHLPWSGSLRRKGEPINPVHQLHPQRTAAERFIRKLLRVGNVVDKNAIMGARRATTTAIAIAGIRCSITYVLIPILAPFLGLFDAIGAPLSIALSSVAIVMGLSGVRRFWLAGHRARWAYTGFIGVVLVLLGVGIVLDTLTIA